MNIQFRTMNNQMGFGGLKSTKDRMERQQKRDDQIAFWNQQKENLKSWEAGSLEEITKKLEMLNDYNNQIDVAKQEYNNEQMRHALDEAQEIGEKIAKFREKFEPKTPEERREDMIEEATGVEKDEGMLSELTDAFEDLVEEADEMVEESLEEEKLEEAYAINEGQVDEDVGETTEINGEQLGVNEREVTAIDGMQLAKDDFGLAGERDLAVVEMHGEGYGHIDFRV